VNTIVTKVEYTHNYLLFYTATFNTFICDAVQMTYNITYCIFKFF